MFPLMYEWHDAKYLGGAHGLVGILYVLIQFPALLKDAALVTEIQSCITSLASLERSDGNFPTREDTTKDAELCQWCHGATSFALLFLKASEVPYTARAHAHTLHACAYMAYAARNAHRGHSL